MRKAELAALPVSLACATFSLPVRLWNIFCNKIEKGGEIKKEALV